MERRSVRGWTGLVLSLSRSQVAQNWKKAGSYYARPVSDPAGTFQKFVLPIFGRTSLYLDGGPNRPQGFSSDIESLSSRLFCLGKLCPSKIPFALVRLSIYLGSGETWSVRRSATLRANLGLSFRLWVRLDRFFPLLSPA